MFTGRGVYDWRKNNYQESTISQTTFSCIVYVNIIGNYIIKLVQAVSKSELRTIPQFLQNHMEDNIPLNLHHHFWFMQDGVPAYFPVFRYWMQENVYK